VLSYLTAIACDLDRIYSYSKSRERRFAIASPTLTAGDTKPIKKFFQQTEAMILNSLNQVRSIIINTIAGREKAIVFLGKTFVVDKAYNSLKEAIAGCRRDLDLGMAVLIAPEANYFNVWVSIPSEMIL
jgi:hypothetical protein